MVKSSPGKKTGGSTSKTSKADAGGTSKLDVLLNLLRQPNGATIHELASGTAWQTHSVRGALAGSLKKKGHVISSEVVEGVRRYRITEAQA
jgi:hypothetical protein